MLETENINVLFREIAAGNPSAFDTLFLAHYERLVRFARTFVGQNGLAEEIVSDVFVAIWVNKEKMSRVNHPDAYLYVSVKNRSINALRNKTYTVPVEEQTDMKKPEHESPHEKLEHNELYDRLNRLVADLPEQQQRVFRMIKESGLTAEQCAQILGLSVRTVETHLYKAVKQLEKEITRYLGYSPNKRQMKKIMSVLW